MRRRRSKYGNIKTMLDGIEFHSKGEARRWAELKLLEAAGEITKLQRQVDFNLDHSITFDEIGVGRSVKRKCKYIADFTYEELSEAGTHKAYVVEDFKGGPLTETFKFKAMLFEKKFGYPIRISRRDNRTK